MKLLNAPAASSPRRPSSALAPLSTPIFRRVWIAAMASNLGSWMQNVAAAWMMATLSTSPRLIALVQTATTLPVFLLAVPAGAIADLADRRKLLLATQAWMLGAAAALGAVTLAGAARPATLLLLTFALGLGGAMNAPAWQSTVPQLVPRDQLAAAIALNSMQFNIARAVGPALGGLAISIWNPGVAFLLNALSFLGVLFVLWSWRGDAGRNDERGESVAEAMRAGFRYVRRAPAMHAVMARTVTFVLGASALWALLPVVAKHEIGSGSGGYGVLLGCLGAGSVGATTVFARWRRLYSADRITVAGALLFAAATFGLGYLSDFRALAAAMVAGGFAWLSTMASFNVSAQTALPDWVRARALSFYLLSFQGSLAIGSWMWGEVASRAGTRVTLLAASASLVAGTAAARRWRLAETCELEEARLRA
ncbi:MAG: MFS transporter [Acidobacteria bacterium]|nr:MFS transporter [Acidobacteriota bacterium]